jgi:hypothetical protein
MTTQYPDIPKRLTAAISKNTAGGKTVLDHEVRWSPDKWQMPRLAKAAEIAERHASSGGGDRLLLSRRNVIDIAKSAEDVAVSFVVAMIWGFGDTGYGPYRVNAILENAGTNLRPRLESIKAAAQQDAGTARDEYIKTSKMRGLGPAFGSKFAYFMAFANGIPSTPAPPLIADINTSWAVWDLAGLDGSVRKRAGYVKYVDLVSHWAGGKWRMDEVELALFEIGKTVRKVG